MAAIKYRVERIETRRGNEWHVYQCQGCEFSIAMCASEAQANHIVEAMNRDALARYAEY